MNWQIRLGTANKKLGPKALVVTLDRSSCPADCPLKGHGCYAESGPMALTWARVSRGQAKADGITRWTGRGFRELARTFEAIKGQVPHGCLVRIGDAGDPSWRGKVSVELLRALGSLRRERQARVILYTHASRAENARAIEIADAEGLALNFSEHHLETRGARDDGETVVVVSEDFWSSRASSGPEAMVTRCPAETRGITCTECGLCARRRGYPIGFTAHGTLKRRVPRCSTGS